MTAISTTSLVVCGQAPASSESMKLKQQAKRLCDRATAHEARHQAVHSRDSQERRLIESSIGASTTDTDKDAKSNRRRELVDGLTALGIPFEWALRCALETNLTISESGTVSWVLEQMEKQASNAGGWLRARNIGDISAENETDDTEIRWPSQASVHAVGACRSAGILDGLTGVGESARSTNSMEGSDHHHNAQSDRAQDDRGASHRYNVILPSLLTSQADAERNFSTPSKVVDTIEDQSAQPSEYFTSEVVYKSDQGGSLDSLLPRPPRQTTSPAGTTPDKSGEPSEEATSLLPLCIAVDAALCVNYSRLAVRSLFKTADGTSGVYASKLYQLITGWIADGVAGNELMRFIRIAARMDHREPRLDCGSFALLGDCGSSPSRQLEQTVALLLEEELAQTLAEVDDGLDAAATNTFPLFGLLFESMQQQYRRAGAFTKAFLRKQDNTNNTTTLEALELDAAWFAWLSGIVYSHVERVMRREVKRSSLGSTLFARAVPSTCYSLAFFSQLATIALAPAPSSAMHWKYVATKLLARICSALKTCQDAQIASPEQKSCPAALSGGVAKAVDNGRVTWFSDSADAFHDALPVEDLVELFDLRFWRENENRVYASEITCAMLELLVHLARPEQERQLMNAVSDLAASEAYELFVDTYSPTRISLSWRHGQIDGGNVIAAASGDGTASTAPAIECDHSGSSIVSLHVQAILSAFTKLDSAEYDSEISPRVQPCQGTTTLRNLAPDTTYRVRLIPVNTNGSSGTEDENAEMRYSNLTAPILNELVVQTPAEPPFELDPANAGKNLTVMSQNLTVKNAVNKKWHSVRGTIGFDEGVHQWQVRIDVCVSKNIFIGVCTAQASLDNYIGSDAFGYGFLANKAIWNNKTKLHSYGEIFKQGDLIRVTLDCNARTLAFSRNGESFGVAATNLRPGSDKGTSSADATSCKWYPAFSLYNKDDQLTLIPPIHVSGSSAAGPHRTSSRYSSVEEIVAAVRCLLSYESGIHAVPQTTRLSTNLRGELSPSNAAQSGGVVEDAYEFFKRWRTGHTVVREIGLGRVIFIDCSRAATEKYGLHKGDTVFTSQGQCIGLGEYQHLLWYEIDASGSFDACDKTRRDRQTEVASWSRCYCLDMLKNSDDFPIHHHRDAIEEGRLNSVDLDASNVTAEKFRECQHLWNRSSEAATWDSTLVDTLDSLALTRSVPTPLHLSFKEITFAIQTDTNSLMCMMRMEQFQGHFDICRERSGGENSPVGCVLARIAFLIRLNASVYRAARFVLPRDHFARSFPGTTATAQQPGHEASMTFTTILASTLSSPLWTTNSRGTVSSQTMRAAMVEVLFRCQKERLMSEDLDRSKTVAPVTPLPSSGDELDAASPTPTATDLPIVSVSYPTRPCAPSFWELLWIKSPTLEHSKRWLLPINSLAMTTLFAQLGKQLELCGAVEWRREVPRAFDALPIRQAFAATVSNPLEARRYVAGEDNGMINHGDGSSCSNAELEQSQDENCENETAESATASVDADPSVEYLQLFECVAKEIQSPGFPLFSPGPSTCAVINVGGSAGSNSSAVKLELDINTSLFMPVIVRDERHCHYPSRLELLGWFFRVGQLFGIAWRSQAPLPLQFLSMSFWDELVDPSRLEAQAAPSPKTSEKEQTEAKTDGNVEREFRARARQEAIDAVRDGLLSIIPSRCLMLCGSGKELRARLSDLDVCFVTALHSRAVYDKEARHHRLFWKVARGFSSMERKLLVKFITARRPVAHGSEDGAGSGELVLELADALHDGRDRPDACYPVVTVVDTRTRRLHLPAYSSAAAMRTKLTLAMTNQPVG